MIFVKKLSGSPLATADSRYFSFILQLELLYFEWRTPISGRFLSALTWDRPVAVSPNSEQNI